MSSSFSPPLSCSFGLRERIRCKDDFRIPRFSISQSPSMHAGAINLSDAAPLPSFPRLISWQVGHASSPSSAACGRSRWLAGIMQDATWAGLRLLLARREQRTCCRTRADDYDIHIDVSFSDVFCWKFFFLNNDSWFCAGAYKIVLLWF